MIRQTVLPFKLERTDEALTAHGGLALLAEYTHALGLRALAERYLPGPGSNRGYAPSAFVETVVLLLQAGGLGRVRDALTTRLLRRDGVETYPLDVDATLVEAEKRDAQWSYQGVKGYMPLLGFLFETPVCLVEEFRAGNVSPGAGHLAVY